MTKWDDRFEEHEVKESIEELIKCVDSFDGSEDPEIVQEFSRIKQAAELARSVLDQVDPVLVPLAPLTAMNKYISTANTHLNTYISSATSDQLAAAQTNIDNMLVQLGNIIVPRSSADLENLKESAKSYRRSLTKNAQILNKQTTEVQATADSVRSSLTGLKDDINLQKARLDDAIARFEKQFSENQNERLESYQSNETVRKSKFDETIDLYTQKLDEIDNKIAQVAGDGANTLEIAASDLTKKIRLELDKAQKLVGIIANTGMAAGYQKVADSKGKSASRWNCTAGLSWVGLIGYAVWASFATFGGSLPFIDGAISADIGGVTAKVQNMDVDWTAFASRLFVATAFGLFAAFATKRGAQNQKFEHKARQMQLELASVGPFLAELPKEKQHTIKEEVARKYFGSDQQPDEQSNAPDGESALLELSKVAITQISNLAKLSK